jgi:hypothetical protein
MLSALSRLGIHVDEDPRLNPPLLGRGAPVGALHALW